LNPVGTFLLSIRRFEPSAGPGSLPMFKGQGGLGLYLERGSASFRNVSLSPL
jgi:hypothetical protein